MHDTGQAGRQAATAADGVRARLELVGLMQQGLICRSFLPAETSKDSMMKFKPPPAHQLTGHPHLLCTALLIDDIIRDS